MDEIRWGIVGPGRIAESVIGDFRHVPAALPVAVGSRSIERARAFADKHRLSAAGSYDELINDDDVDALYIATPHPQHLHPALAAIKCWQGRADREDVHRDRGRCRGDHPGRPRPRGFRDGSHVDSFPAAIVAA